MRASAITKLLLMLALLLMFTSAILPAAASDQIQRDLASGVISADEATILSAIALAHPGQLPSRYAHVTMQPVKCATDLMQQAFLAVLENPDLSLKYRGILESRPVTDTTYDSPLGYFRLHYDTSGAHAVPAGDTNSNGVPDHIERAADLADSVWLLEVGDLGYPAPPSDGTLGGGENIYDIYFQAMQEYGYTSPETAGPEPWDDYSSHMVVNTTFQTAGPNDDPEGQIMGALKVTLAHEFYHAIQYSYNVFADSYFMEMCSTWMEEFAYPMVNDNYQYLPRYFDEPQDGFKHDGTHKYGSFIWPEFLEENFEAALMHDMWNHCKYNSAYNAMAHVLDTLGTSFNKQFARFLSWNFLTGSRGAVGHYLDAADYPEVHIMRTHTVIPDSNYYSVEPPEAMASNYIVVENPGSIPGIFTFEMDGDPLVTWVAAYIVDYGDGMFHDTVWTSFSNGEGKLYVQYFEDVQRVIIAPGITSSYGDVHNFFYDIYMRPMGDADGNHILNISDVTFMVAYIFGGGPASHPLAAMDADCNRVINISDAVRMILYIFGGGPAPCE